MKKVSSDKTMQKYKNQNICEVFIKNAPQDVVNLFRTNK